MKSEFKREVKKKIQKKMISKLKSLETTKLRTVAIEGFGKKNYMSGMFNGTEVSEVLKVKLHMIKAKCNYNKGEDRQECRFCYGEGETTEHLFFECKKLEMIRESSLIEKDVVNDEKESVKRILDMARRIKLVIGKE